MRRRVFFVAPAFVALFAAAAPGCLPDPAPRATIDINVRGGERDVVTNDGYLLHMERRLLVVGVGTSSSATSLVTGASYLRNLDVAPFSLPGIRARGDRFVVVATTSYFQGTPVGPGVAPEDVDLLDGDPAGQNARTNVASFAIVGSLAKGGRTWTFSWHGSLFDDVVCARMGAAGLAPFTFDSGSHYTIDVVARLEYEFSGTTSGIFGQPMVDADTNGDGHVDEQELVQARLTNASRQAVPAFEVSIDGEALFCHPASSGFPSFDGGTPF